jgi:hypothetical protein
VWLECLGQLKNPFTSSGIETTALLLVVQCLKQLRYRLPLETRMTIRIKREGVWSKIIRRLRMRRKAKRITTGRRQ